jgi:hypothetical protein
VGVSVTVSYERLQCCLPAGAEHVVRRGPRGGDIEGKGCVGVSVTVSYERLQCGLPAGAEHVVRRGPQVRFGLGGALVGGSVTVSYERLHYVSLYRRRARRAARPTSKGRPPLGVFVHPVKKKTYLKSVFHSLVHN